MRENLETGIEVTLENEYGSFDVVVNEIDEDENDEDENEACVRL